MRKEKEESKFRRFVLPIMAICACVFMVFCAIMGHGVFPCQAAAEAGEFSFPVLFYLIVFAVIMALGWVLDLKNKNKTNNLLTEKVAVENKEEKTTTESEVKESKGEANSKAKKKNK